LQSPSARRSFERFARAPTTCAGGSTGVIERLQAALGGVYRIERELGAGGMATVYLAVSQYESDVWVANLRW
jgi:hypothetical protein